MGWTVFSKAPQGGMVAAVGRSLEFDGRQIVASARVGGEFYAAVRNGDKVSAYVALIDGFSYKILSEDEGPYYWQCPAAVLEVLSPTASPWALKWREKCAGVMA